MIASNIELGASLSPSGRDQADHLAEITADAFRNDPFNEWLFGSFEAMAITFRALARHVYTKRGYCYRLGNQGAAMWLLPGASSDLPLAVYPALLHAVWRSKSGGLKRIQATTDAMASHHPKFPHAYLFTIGVRPTAQGKGLGRQLIRPVLEACDRAGIPAYLENSNPDNRGFYGANGFERVGMIHPIEGCPPLEAMVRQPRPNVGVS
jgi:GNAT superfamily N-acetyltransferase